MQTGSSVLPAFVKDRIIRSYRPVRIRIGKQSTDEESQILHTKTFLSDNWHSWLLEVRRRLDETSTATLAKKYSDINSKN